MSIDSLDPILELSPVTISHGLELANSWLCRVSPGPQRWGGRRSRRLAIRALRAELVVAERALVAAAGLLLVAGGGPALQEWRRCLYREVALRAALAALVDFGLGE